MEKRNITTVIYDEIELRRIPGGGEVEMAELVLIRHKEKDKPDTYSVYKDRYGYFTCYRRK